MSDTSMLQSVFTLFGSMLFVIAAAFMVYWNLLGKKRLAVTLQKKNQPAVQKSAQLAVSGIRSCIAGDTPRRSTVPSRT
ncbi:MAG: hypothetical protein Q7V04_03180 [Deltaproteobacteria bacterium]|nr:hypothetical protein [Deltaproteobacteria bacterium]